MEIPNKDGSLINITEEHGGVAALEYLVVPSFFDILRKPTEVHSPKIRARRFLQPETVANTEKKTCKLRLLLHLREKIKKESIG